MAQRVVAIIRNLPAALAAGLVLLLTFGSLAAVLSRAQAIGGVSASDWAAVRFTIWQAILSATISVVLAIPTARALARRRFRGRAVLITLLGAPFILPVIVAVLGLLSVFGRSGLVNSALVSLGLPEVSIYGLQGVVLAHVFFNLPLATRLILQGWLAIPAEQFRLAASLNAPVGRFLERPMLRQIVPGAWLVIFLICLTSFAVALTLGGGPRATTVELAIYQALLFEFDLARAAFLAAIQFGLCVAAATAVYWVAVAVDGQAGLDRTVQRFDSRHTIITDALCLGFVALFLMIPLAMIVGRGLPGLLQMPVEVYFAALRSVLVALSSALLCIAMSLALCLRGGPLVHIVSALPLAASALVVGTGLFLMSYPFVSPSDIALPVTVLVNATLALPFSVRVLAPDVATVQRDYTRLAQSLRLTGLNYLRLVVLPRLRRPLGFAAGLAAALSMGDLGVITLFAGQSEATLPLAMFRLMGAYQMEAAAGAGLMLLALSLTMFWLFDRGGRSNADA